MMPDLESKQSKSGTRWAPLALLVACLLSFGILIPWLGFYWDDWPAIWYAHFFGTASFPQHFAADRPLLGYLFVLTTPWLGETPSTWQLFGLAMRWLSSLALYWTLRELWPARRSRALWVALLVAVYPGFLQQYISVTYSHVLIVLTVFFSSLALMIWAVRRPRWFWPAYLLSLAASAFSMVTVEYFFGLELLRPALLWIVLSERMQTTRRKILRVLTYWAPYLFIMIAFLVWRVFLSETPRGQVRIFSELMANPLGYGLRLLSDVGGDLLESTVLAWLRTLNVLALRDYSFLLGLAYLAVLLVTGGLAFFYLRRSSEPEMQAGGNDRSWARQAVALGVYALLIGGWPFWATALPIRLRFPWDRFTLALMLGASLLFAGLVDLLLRSRRQKVWALSIAIALAAGMHFTNGLSYVQDWELQKSYFWQLTWRMPDIEPGTAMITSRLPFRYYSDNSLTAPFNWIYAPDFEGREMPYVVYDLESRHPFMESYAPGTPIDQAYRAAAFHGTTSQAIVYFMTLPRCVEVIEPEIEASHPVEKRYLPPAVDLSNPNLIRIHPDQPRVPPENLFGPEPAPNWCTYYEKAELARQERDWQTVAALGDQAAALLANDGGSGSDWIPQLEGLAAGQDWAKMIEFLPFIEGYAHTGRWDRAEELTGQVRRVSEKMDPLLCETWARLRQDAPASAEKTGAVERVQNELGCATP